MKPVTKIAMAGLATAAVIAVSQVSAAVVEPTVTTGSVNGQPVITPFNTDPVIKNETVAGTATTKQFNIPAGFGYVKVSFVNTSARQFTFTINQGTPPGAQKMSGTVPADGEEHVFFNSSPWSTGWFYVNISSSQGMTGKLGVRIGTNLDELKNS